MRGTVEGLERERDFYFGKLRDIEVLCQESEEQNNPVLQSILDILYATEVSYSIYSTLLYRGKLQYILYSTLQR